MHPTIEVENGKVMDIDGQKLVIGYACPGLTKSLKLTTYEPTEDIDIPEYVEVTADVTDFSLDFTATIISSGLLEDMDLKDLDEVDDLSDNMKKLEEATDQTFRRSRSAGRRIWKHTNVSESDIWPVWQHWTGSRSAGERTAGDE